MEPSLSYHEYSPPPALRGVVRCFWTSHSSQRAIAPASHRIAPDGCMDWLFDFGCGQADSARVIGTMSKALNYVQHGVVDLLGVRFHPGAHTALLRLDAAELLDADAKLECFLGRASHSLWESLASLDGASRRARLAAEILRRLASTPDAYVAHCVARLETSAGLLKIGGLEQSTGLSARQLERKFTAHVGVSPKVFARIVRLKHVLARIEGNATPDWVTIAQETGHADQAHLIREFRKLMGCKPTDYVRAQG